MCFFAVINTAKVRSPAQPQPGNLFSHRHISDRNNIIIITRLSSDASMFKNSLKKNLFLEKILQRSANLLKNMVRQTFQRQIPASIYECYVMNLNSDEFVQ